MPGHHTGFNDHDESVAAIAVLEGAIHEDRMCLEGAADGTYREGSILTVPRYAAVIVEAGVAAANSSRQRLTHSSHRRSNPLRRSGSTSPSVQPTITLAVVYSLMGLVARIVEPIAPNFWALRRVSSNAERE